MNKEEIEKRDSLDNSLTFNKYCYCKDYIGQNKKCLICESLDQGIDYTRLNQEATGKYLIAITGTNGKTTVTNIIGILLNQLFGNVSQASSTGIYSDGKMILPLEHRASEHYVYLLNQREGKIVVSEQPEAGIYKFGLPIDHQIGIITNITEDHLDRYWVKNGMQDIYNIKSLIIKMATEGVVISPDSPWTKRAIEEFNHTRFFLFSTHKQDLEEYKNIYPITFLDGNKVLIIDKEKITDCGLISDYLLTCGGILEYNCKNILAVITLLYNSQLTKNHFDKAIQLLKKIPPTFLVNPARFNIMKLNNKIIVIDYAHNKDGYNSSLPSFKKICQLKGLTKSIGLISLTEGKSSQDIEYIAKLISGSFSKVSVRVKNMSQDLILLNKLINDFGVSSEIYNSDFDKFIDEFRNSNYDICYITLAGLGKVREMERLISKYNINDINIDDLIK